MNKAVFYGNLTKDIELKKTPNDISTCSFTVAVRRNYKNASGEYEADFINCVAWRSTAEFIAKYFTKGQGIIVCGRIQTRSYDGDDGKKRYVTEVVAEEVDFVGAKKSDKPSQTAQTSNADEELPDLDMSDIPLEDDSLNF